MFALKLEELGFVGADLLVPMTFMVIIGTVVIQSASAGPLANWLKVSEPEPRGVLIIGANNVSRAIAKELKELGFRTLLTDTNWEHIRAARMDGLKTYYGNAVSDHADRHLDLVGIGRLFAMSRRPALNALACLRYKNELGVNNVFSLQTPEEKEAKEKQVIARHYTGPRLFGKDITQAKLASLISKGADIRKTKLSENFDFTAYREQYQGKAIPLFAIDKKGNLRVFTSENGVKPDADWTIISLIPAEVLEELKQTDVEKNTSQQKDIDPNKDNMGV